LHIAIGHRRLSIIDVEGGTQPRLNEADDLHISFNGEIYDYHDLRTSLENRGHVFRTHSDTETIVHHFEDTNTDGFSALNGMFAFALFDRRNGELSRTLARDRAGSKPLFYAPLPCGGVVFSSEIFSLLQHASISREIDQDALDDYFLENTSRRRAQ